MTHLRTRAVRAGQHPDPTTGAIATPISQTTAFGYGTLERGAAIFAGEAPGYRYSRFANPTVAALEAKTGKKVVSKANYLPAPTTSDLLADIPPAQPAKPKTRK